MASSLLTARDEEIARWVARMGPVTVLQVMRRFGIGRLVAYRRVRALRDHGYLDRDTVAARRPGVLMATGLAEDLNERAATARRLAPHQIPMHLAAVDVAIAHEVAGTPVFVLAELARHPALLERLPATADGAPVRPDVLALTEPLRCVYAPSGAARAPKVLELAAAAWPKDTRGLLIVDERRADDVPPGLPACLELRVVDLATAGNVTPG